MPPTAERFLHIYCSQNWYIVSNFTLIYPHISRNVVVYMINKSPILNINFQQHLLSDIINILSLKNNKI